jgi:hypothetical protein
MLLDREVVSYAKNLFWGASYLLLACITDIMFNEAHFICSSFPLLGLDSSAAMEASGLVSN